MEKANFCAVSPVLKRLEDIVYLGLGLLKNNILKCFWWHILYIWFSSSYLVNPMKMAMEWKAINNEIKQWKTINRADKANLLII